jgi:C_GCAxxG_C_C family probable redox protein
MARSDPADRAPRKVDSGRIGERARRGSPAACKVRRRECEMSRTDDAVELFRSGHACSQAILMAWAPEYDLDAAQAARLAAGFAAGMRVGEVCGAATGAFMVMGLALCGDECVTREGRAQVASAVGMFAERFREKMGSLDCPDIIGCDLRTPEGMAIAQEQSLFGTRCVPAVRAAGEILDDMLSPT